MAKLEYTPSSRKRNRSTDQAQTAKDQVVAFLVFGTSGQQTAPAFHRLLRGVSDAATNAKLSLVFSFVGNPDELPPRVMRGQINGLLLHGPRPTPAVQAHLRNFPTVWLMANPQRAQWGDQVMPNNPAVGELAARYLFNRGHRNIACLNTTPAGWALRLRGWTFTDAVTEMGGSVHNIYAEEARATDFWSPQWLIATARLLVDQLLEIKPRPSGVFVMEDRLLPAIDKALAERGVDTAPGGPFEIISCNNERPYMAGLRHVPPTIDIRPDLIGQKGVAQLLWKMQNPETDERTSILVEPRLVLPDTEKPEL